MHPASILSYYPHYSILDEVIYHNGGYKNLNIFIDLKNNLQTLYMEHAIINIVESSRQRIDTSIFSSVISFLSFHKVYAMKREINVNFIIFFETGHSYYHKNISKTYKFNRQIDDLYGLDKADRELFGKALQTNFQMIESACNKIPNIKVFRLPHLEADFIPYYLRTRNVISTENAANILYSNDHDMWQCLEKDMFIFSKGRGFRKLLKPGEAMKNFLKKDTTIPDSFLPLAMAIIGDPGDNVDGIKGIGPASFIKMFEEIVSYTGDIDTINENVFKNKPLFNISSEKIKNKNIKKVIESEEKNKQISNNLKLVSFELLSMELDDPSSTEILDKRKFIEKIGSDKLEKITLSAIQNACIRAGVDLEDNTLEYLYS